MKKLVTLFLGLFLWVSIVPAQEYWDQYLIDEDFDGLSAMPVGWSYINTTKAGAVFGRDAGASYVDAIKITGAGGGNRGGEVHFPLEADSSTIYVNMDLMVAKSTITNRNSFQFFLLGSHSLNVGLGDGTAFADVIAGLYWVGTSGKFHVWNKDLKGPVPVEKPDTIIHVYDTGQYPSYRRAGNSNLETDSLNLSTITDVTYAKGEWFNLAFKLNFVTKKMDVTITQKSDPENTQTISDLPFINQASTDFVSFSMVNNRSSNLGNASNSDLEATVDNFKVYQKVKSLGNAAVTIKYQDLAGNTVKADRVDSDQEVGLMYKLEADDVASFTASGNYYAFDLAATGEDFVTVASGGSSIIVRFKSTPATTGTYVWKGTASQYLNELDANFSTDNSNEIGYQMENAIKLSKEDAPIKDIIFNSALSLGSEDFSVDKSGYTVAGTGVLKGTGSIRVNASATLGFINKMTGPVYITKDTLTVTNVELANKYVVSDGVTLVSKVNMGTPIEGNGGTFTFVPSVSTFTNRITGMDQVNFSMSAKGNLKALSGVPRMNFVLDSLAKMNVTSSTADTVIFDTNNNYKYNALHLGENVFLSHSAAPAANGTTVVELGELSGDANSVLFGNNVRKMTYNVGSLNTDATFSGILDHIDFDAWNNRADYDIAKVGTGKWTLAGNSPDFFGSVKVLNGILEVNDTLCNMQGEYLFGAADALETVPKLITEVIVADTATLAGSGFLGANSVNVNGTITGNLIIGGSLSLKPDLGEGGATTIINVTTAAVDKITVKGDLYYGGKLKVNVISLPQIGDYQILEFGSAIESGLDGFDNIELPSLNWSFDYLTGMLTYKGGDESAVKDLDYTKEILSVEYYDITGKRVRDNHKGVVFSKVKYTDGTTSTTKSFMVK